MPLIQQAISEEFARPVEEVSVAVQQLDGGNMQMRSYSKAALTRSQRRFARLSRKLEGDAG